MRNGTPWNGPSAANEALDLYLDVIDHVGEAAKRAHERGVPLEEAASAYQLPEAAAEWRLFNPRYFEVAMGAWFAELDS